MMIKWNGKNTEIETMNLQKYLQKRDLKFAVDCIRIYARYAKNSSIYSNNFKIISIEAQEIDLEKEVSGFEFEHHSHNVILGYQLYYAKKDNSRAYDAVPTRPVSSFWCLNSTNNTEIDKQFSDTILNKNSHIIHQEQDSEIDATDKNIYYFFEHRGFYFPKEILTRYFMSLKTKPFVILTGISGTGKTKIAQIFAEYIRQDDTPEERSKRIAFVSVRPDWMDNRGLLGYYNLLDEKYHTTVVTEILLEAAQNPDKPYFIVLDEMNLAKVEQYFSDFLSIMESRTPSNPHGEPIRLHHAEEVDAHNGSKIPGKLNIPPNVFFTGTVNVDESTYMFSPKVLDRANVIEFNDVNIASYSKGYSESGEFVLKESNIIKKLMPSGNEKPFCSRADYDKAGEYVDNFFEDLLGILSPYNLHFGYRVINEISRFVTNAKEEIGELNIDDVLDIQMLQKILPKFHGSQAKLEDPLKKLLMFCYSNTAAGESFNEADIDKAIQNGDIRFPCSARKLSRMLRNLKAQGYTSFIE